MRTRALNLAILAAGIMHLSACGENGSQSAASSSAGTNDQTLALPSASIVTSMLDGEAAAEVTQTRKVAAAATPGQPACPEQIRTAGAMLPICYAISALPASAIYVSPSGNDNGAGTVTSPFRTLAKAYARVASGGTIVLRSGTYADGWLEINKTGLTIQAYPNELPVFSGAQILDTGWNNEEGGLAWHAYTPMPVTDGSGIKVTDSTQLRQNGINDQDPVGIFADQAWLGAAQLKQVASKASVRAGSFYVDRTAKRVYLSRADASMANISARKIQVSANRQFAQVNAPNLTLRGIKITRYSNTPADHGVIRVEAPASTLLLDNVEITDAAFQAIHFGGNKTTYLDNPILRNVSITGSNWMGVVYNYVRNPKIRWSKIANSNLFSEFLFSPQSGAIKTAKTRHVNIYNSDFIKNNSHGLWFDQSSYDVTIANSKIIDNAGAGVFFEISDQLLMVNNYVRAPLNATTSLSPAVKLAGSSGLRLINNTIVGGSHALGILTDSRSRPGCADPRTASCIAENSDRDYTADRPASIDWMPRLDVLLNNVIAFPTQTGYCDAPAALCITTKAKLSKDTRNPWTVVPIESILHPANASRGIPATLIAGNIYQVSGEAATPTPIITKIQDTPAKHASLPAWQGYTQSAPIQLGLDLVGGSLFVTGDDPNLAPAKWVCDGNSTRLQGGAPVPVDPLINTYLAAGTTRYGCQISR